MGDQTAPQHAILDITPKSAPLHVSKSNDLGEKKEVSRNATTQSRPKSHDTLRQYRLQIVTFIFNHFNNAHWRADMESRKVVTRKSRNHAVLFRILHIVPLAAAIALLVLQYKEHLVSYDSDYATALQFAAKFHELLMQASIVDILFCLIRNELIRGFVPLGALSGAMQPLQLSYLVSLDFFSIFRSHAVMGWPRLIFVLVVPTLIVLTSLVGPSSAVLLIPRPNTSRTPANGTVTLYSPNSVDALYPSRISLTKHAVFDWDRFNTTFIYTYPYELDTDTNDDMAEYALVYIEPDDLTNPNTGLLDPTYDRALRYSYSATDWHDSNDEVLFLDRRTNATIPTELLMNEFSSGPASDTYALSSFNSTMSVMASLPVVEVQCWAREGRKVFSNSSLYYWTDDGSSRTVLAELNTFVEQLSAQFEYEDLPHENGTDVWFAPIWLPSPEPTSQSLLVVLISGRVPSDSNASRQTSSSLFAWMLTQLDLNGDAEIRVDVCTVNAFWNTAKIDLVLYGHLGLLTSESSSAWKHTRTRPISLDLDGSEILQSARFARFVRLDRDLLIATSLAVTLSKLPESRYNDTSTALSIDPPFPLLGNANQTAFKFITTEYGYGYGNWTRSVYLAIGVLTLYCTITFNFIVYVLTSGFVSTAWNSAIELFSLALQSEKPDHLGHTAVGIDSIKTFSKGVGVRVNGDNELELVFAETSQAEMEARGLTKVERNKEY